ncbi:hypothetical protein PMI14_03259 [Acidovorax sp. CF316]|uniref:hypothetical protein n=1 Tax=Acidovorax sp. CF316 TaxID=1144317 RepID=UPI00026BE20C|nr:hypothetical protein [Acidovorax sp. CF316]EJE52147.1 hypothetical protein PMI14_03259 [Acidovorax sp. CF316]
MFRSLVAVFLLHFLLCVGISVVGSSKPLPSFEPQQDLAVLSQTAPGHEVPGANSDADDHALLDDRQDFPDLLQPMALAGTGAAAARGLIPLAQVRTPSVALAPPHKPPKAPGILA